MNSFLCRLNPLRSTFPADITPEKGALMREHIAYWTTLMERGGWLPSALPLMCGSR